jgi:hypothetical protein
VRLKAAGDRELAAGLRLALAGNTAAGRQKVNAAANAHDCLLNLSNSDVAHADGLVGIDRALAKPENGWTPRVSAPWIRLCGRLRRLGKTLRDLGVGAHL